VKSTDELFRFHNRLVIPRPARALKKVLLFEYHNNACHSNYRRVLAALLKRYWWDKMAFDCKAYCYFTFYVIDLNPIEGGLLVCTLWAYLNTLGKLLELIMSQIYQEVLYLVIYQYSL